MKKEKFYMRLSTEQKQILQDLANQHMMNMSAFIWYLIQKEIR